MYFFARNYKIYHLFQTTYTIIFRHVGDLGNLVVQNKKAAVTADNQNSFVRLSGPKNVIGRSIVVSNRQITHKKT